jgi:hypothetical protein
MRKLSIVGLTLSGTYAALTLLAIGCAWVCTPAPGPHGNAWLALAPFLPAYEVLLWSGNVAALHPMIRSWQGSGLVLLATAAAFYCVGWLIGIMGAWLKRTIS